MESLAPFPVPRKLGIVVQGTRRQEDQKFQVKSKIWILSKFKAILGWDLVVNKQKQLILNQRANASLNTGLYELL